jgi:hypothetical protein
LGNVAATYNPLSWLSATYRVGTDVYTDQRKQVYEIGSNATGDYNFQGEIRENTLNHREVYADLLVTMKKSLGKDIQTSLTLGNNLNSRYNKDLFARGRFLTIPNFHNLSNASAFYTSENSNMIRSAAFELLLFNAMLDNALNLNGVKAMKRKIFSEEKSLVKELGFRMVIRKKQ